MGVDMYAGGAPSSLNLISIATPDNCCSGWWVHVLKALDRNVDKKYSSNFGMFSLVAGNGSLSGISGVEVRSKHGTSSSSHEAAALVEWLSALVFSITVACDFDKHGNPSGRRPNSNKAFYERYKAREFCDTWTILLFFLIFFTKHCSMEGEN